MNSKLSIVMAHYNRFPLLYNTLQSIYDKHAHQDVQTIVVDDGSIKIEGKEKIFKFPITYIQLPEKKWYKNPVIPYNVGIEYSESDIVMIQNPECYHFDDVVTHTLENLKPNEYYSYSCYSLPENKSPEDIKSKNDFVMKTSESNGAEGWYNHSVYRPKGFHFCCSLHRSTLKTINNFSREYAWGHWFDDDDFILKVKSLKNINSSIIDDHSVLHQYHYNKNNTYNTVDWALVYKNKNIFDSKNQIAQLS